jgi:hypothetical protein
MSLPYLRSLVLAAAAIAITLPANAALESRLNGTAVYDTSTNLTWLTNASLAATNAFGLTLTTLQPNGEMSWNEAQAWVAGMDSQNYLGSSTWRLPTLAPLNGTAFNFNAANYDGTTDFGYNKSGFKGDELSYLYYNTLGNEGATRISPTFTGWSACGNGSTCLTNPGPFTNVQTNYWYGTTTSSGNAGVFGITAGNVFSNSTINARNSAMVVATGDVLAAVPEPETYAMMLAGLGMIGLMVRRRNPG